MRSLYIIITVLISSFVFAQPHAFKYQSVVRDSNGELLVNTNVAFQISILKEAVDGNAVYVEEHQATTSNYGSVTLEIGRGENPTSDFSAIDWGSSSHFIQIAWDLTGGTNYELAGTSELLSVPFALNAKTATSTERAANGFDKVSTVGDTLYLSNGRWIIIPGISEANKVEESSGSFIDTRDGNVYNYVTIGNQVWMAENLKYLPSVVGSDTSSEITPFYYVYDYDGVNIEDAKATSNYTAYGVLYNWSAAMAGSASSVTNPSGVQGVCPIGWHLPSDAEWIVLTDYLGGENEAGGKLKE